MRLTRRQFLKALALVPVLGVGESGVGASLYKLLGEGYPVATPLTEGPSYHWFGYYDKLQFDSGGRYVLGMESRFENRSPTPRDIIGVAHRAYGFR